MRDAYDEAARALGHELARRGYGLVYGGGRVGALGAVADAALESGGQVIGVIPSHLVHREFAHDGVTELVVVDSIDLIEKAHLKRVGHPEWVRGNLSITRTTPTIPVA